MKLLERLPVFILFLVAFIALALVNIADTIYFLFTRKRFKSVYLTFPFASGQE